MPFTKELPEWGNPGQRPPQTSIDQGYKPMDHPPADWFNWYQYTAYQALKELQTIGATKEDVSSAVSDAKAYTDKHEKRTDNPHKTTKAQVGLGNVDNVQQASKVDFDAHTKDSDSHITATERSNWNAKETTTGAQNKADTAEKNAKAYTDELAARRDNPHEVTKEQIGLSNVDNVKQADYYAFRQHDNNGIRHVSQADKDKWNGAQLSKITNDIGGVSFAVNEGEDMLQAIVNRGRGMGTFYANGKAVNSPSTASTRGFYQMTSQAEDGKGQYGWVYAMDYRNNVFTNYWDGNTVGWQGWKRLLSDVDLSPSWNTVSLINGAKQDSSFPFMFSVVNNTLWLAGSFGSLPSIGTVVAKFAYKPTRLLDFVVPTIGSYGIARFAFTTNGELRYDGMMANDNSAVTRVSFDKPIPLW
ncbi:hypothetical protein [Bacillus nakamurai]|uniref:hypothetical protein n=1 Tax=Bacillus nakamurai TaxID=1793963 RepID=UPI0020C5A608|nr:hypothetical protein [Bacillus nakamurai]